MRILLPGQRPARMSLQEIALVEKMAKSVAELEKEHNLVDYDTICHDNRSESYRNGSTGSLLVKRAPHEVRPPADTGVQYTIHPDENLDLSLNDSPQSSKYDWKYLTLDTSHTMCQACRDVLNYYCHYKDARLKQASQPEEKGRQFPLSNTVIHHFNIFSLLAWAMIDKCWLCQILLKHLELRFGNLLGEHNYQNYRIQLCWPQKTKMEESDTLYFVMTEPTKPVDNWNFSHFYRMEVWPVNVLPQHYEPVTLDETDRISKLSELTLEDQTSTRSSTSKALAKSWLSQCRSNKDGKHQECNKRDKTYIPTRLLDVRHAQRTSLLRLVCTELKLDSFVEDREWMTLSHCWGEWGAQHNPVLLKSNLEERQNTGLRLVDLPQTFQDAVEIACWFGINWIWIDCLCIIQDSKEDWLHEAGMMSQIYQNAQINISADIGVDSRAGCFAQRDVIDITPLQISCPQLSQTWKVIPVAGFMFGWMFEATSISRAWIHRERQLARRVLHFTAGEMVWECCGVKGTAFASEMLPIGAPFENGLFNMDHKYQIGRLQQGLMEGEEETYATWNDICERLSEKHLTKPSDMPIVLSGMAKDFSNVLPGEKFIAGLWESTLPHSLLWTTKVITNPELEYVAPSWSWLSAGVAVQLANRSSIKSKHPIAKILTETTKLKYDDLYGPVESSALEIESVLRRIQISFESSGRSKPGFNVTVFEDNGDAEFEFWREIGNSWDDFFGEMCWLELDTELEEPFLDCYCLFVTMQQWFDNGASRDLACLLLKPVDGDEIACRRIGTIVFRHTLALKMRYAMDWDLEDDVWEGIQKAINNNENKTRIDRRERKGDEEAQDSADSGDNPTSAEGTATEQPQGLDALYQFDDIIGTKGFEKISVKLELETVVIV